MNRRTFFQGLTSAAALISMPAFGRQLQDLAARQPFRMKFSPEINMFNAVVKDPADQVKMAYDYGFEACENTGLKFRSTEDQEKISRAVQSLGMEFGQFVGTLTFEDVTFAGRDNALREKVLEDVRVSVEIARRMNTKIIHNVLGMADPKLPYDFQMTNAIELLKRIADIYEPHGIVMVMESMNHRIDHPGMFLHTIPQAYALAKAVGSPNVKVLYDFYHVQIQEGNLLPTLDYAWDEIAYIQMGDTPGRLEPTTGEINFPNVLRHVRDKGYRGFVGLEHGRSKEGKAGVDAMVKAYRSVDPE